MLNIIVNEDHFFGEIYIGILGWDQQGDQEENKKRVVSDFLVESTDERNCVGSGRRSWLSHLLLV